MTQGEVLAPIARCQIHLKTPQHRFRGQTVGAQPFYETYPGDSPEEAFNNARAEALAEFGDEGYSGTIAEKESFVLIPMPVGGDAENYARMLVRTGDARIADKWGPAGCLEAKKGLYLFFGLASM